MLSDIFRQLGISLVTWFIASWKYSPNGQEPTNRFKSVWTIIWRQESGSMVKFFCQRDLLDQAVLALGTTSQRRNQDMFFG
jgi:hypothetical protein